MNRILIFPLLLTFSFAASTHAHEPSSIDKANHLTIAAAFGFQNDSIADNASNTDPSSTDSLQPDSQAWLLPGLLIGGESVPRTKGFALDDLQLIGRLNLANHSYMSGKLGYHQHGDSDELSLENFWLGHYVAFRNQIIKVDAGLMSTTTTDTANHHSSTDFGNNKPLLAAAFFGGHHSDAGLKLSWYWQQFELGAEVWNGNHWPTTATDGAQSYYAKFHGQMSSLKTDIGAWVWQGKANQRSDTRYEVGHSHSNVTITAPDGQFSGDITMYGGYLKLEKKITPSVTLQSAIEWIKQDQQGQLTNTLETAQVNLNSTGVMTKLGVWWHTHALQLQHEILIVDNHFLNTTETFIKQQGLYNENFEPQRSTLTYRWRWRTDATLRFEYIVDKTQIEQSEQVWSLGFTWVHNLL